MYDLIDLFIRKKLIKVLQILNNVICYIRLLYIDQLLDVSTVEELKGVKTECYWFDCINFSPIRNQNL